MIRKSALLVASALVGLACICAVHTPASARQQELAQGEQKPAKNTASTKWFENARSTVGGYCCADADGYRLGKRYMVYDGGPNKVERQMFASLLHLSDGSYQAKVWDMHTHEYKDVSAGSGTFVPDNPTGDIIVWLHRPGSNDELKVRCLALQSQS